MTSTPPGILAKGDDLKSNIQLAFLASGGPKNYLGCFNLLCGEASDDGVERSTRSSEVSIWRRTTRTIVRQTIKGWSTSTSTISSMHCTGEPFYEILKAEFPKKVIRSYTGTKLVFGA